MEMTLRSFLFAALAIMMILATVAAQPATKPASRPAPTQESPRRVHAFISGKVQGVGFRAFTKQRADELGVKGWVKNLLDGRVEAVMQGAPDSIEKLLATVRKGPRSSRVEGVEVKDEKIAEEYHDFRVIEGQ